VTGLKAVRFRVGDALVHVDPTYKRLTEVDLLVGDAAKAERELGWKSQTDLDGLIRIMVAADVERARKGSDDF
jgi:GDPmannose 4,6-dehydratase